MKGIVEVIMVRWEVDENGEETCTFADMILVNGDPHGLVLPRHLAERLIANIEARGAVVANETNKVENN